MRGSQDSIVKSQEPAFAARQVEAGNHESSRIIMFLSSSLPRQNQVTSWNKTITTSPI